MLELLISQLQAGTPPTDLDYDTVQVLTAPDAVGGISSGVSVAISDNSEVIVIGASQGKSGSIASGCAYIYEKTNGVYNWTHKLTPSTVTDNAQFGYRVALSADGSVIAVSAYGDIEKGLNAGAAYIYHRTGLIYREKQKIIDPTGGSSDRFGSSVVVSSDGSLLLIGAQSGYNTTARTGFVRPFVYDGVSYVPTDKIVASDGAASDNFGYSVAMSSDKSIIIVGSYGDDDTVNNSGSVYVFKHDGTSYSQAQKLTAYDADSNDRFGWSAAISSDNSTIVVGSYQDDDKGAESGSVYIFRYNGNNYEHAQKLIATDGAAGDEFGFSISISSDASIIVVGSRRDDDKGSDSGSAYVFKHNGQSYQEIKKLVGNKNVTSGGFGYSVAIAGDTYQIVVGALGWTDDSDSRTGAGFVFS